MPRDYVALIALFCFGPAQAASPHQTTTGNNSRQLAGWSADAANDPAPTPRLGPHSSGSAVLRAQILLDRAHFSVGEINGAYSENMRNTLRAYQSAHGLADSGIVNQETWEMLDCDIDPVIGPYTITETDLAGPFETIPEDMVAKSKLAALGYASPLEELGERFHAAPDLLRKLNPSRDFGKLGEEILVPQVTRTLPTEEAVKVVVTGATKSVDALDAGGNIIARYPVTVGSKHDPLPVGEWTIVRATDNPVFHYNSDLFWDADRTHAQATIAPGPNNPVGVEWIGLSKEHYGIHGTPEPSQIGKTHSHGCLRLTNWDAQDLARMVKPGMVVEMRSK